MLKALGHVRRRRQVFGCLRRRARQVYSMHGRLPSQLTAGAINVAPPLIALKFGRPALPIFFL